MEVMKRMIGSLMACLCLLTTTSFPAPVLVSIDVSSLLGHKISLEFQLFENGGEFDSVVKVDNVSLDGTLHDFEAANALDVWHSFPDPLDPAATRKGGTINGAGSSIMEIAEGFPTLASTDFSAITITGPTLSFYLDAAMSGVVLPSPTPGQVIYFLDEFIVFIYDLTINNYAINVDGVVVFDADNPLGRDRIGTTVQPIPEPSALLLGVFGLGAMRRAGPSDAQTLSHIDCNHKSPQGGLLIGLNNQSRIDIVNGMRKIERPNQYG